MAQTYTRQSTFADGDTITASLFNDEYNQLVNVFAYSSTDASSTGHRHDGTAAQGGNIPKVGDLDFLNKIEVDSTNNRWGFYVEVSSAAVEQIRIQDGAIVPVTDNDIDLGTSSLEFKDLYIDGTANIDTLSVDTSATIAGLTVSGTSTLQGDVYLGNASADTIFVPGLFQANLIPENDSLWNLGSTSLYWANAYIDAITTTGNVTVGGNLTVTGTTTFNGGTITMGDAASDNVVFGADVNSNIIPNTDNTYDLGSSSQEWKDLYIDGTAYLDAINFNGTAITATAAELNIMDGVTSTATELNIVDGDTTATSTTLADADRVVVNDAGTMVQVALTDFETYFESALDTLSNVTTVGALNAGSITSGFGAIDNGSSAITTTGTVTYGSLSDGTITVTAFVDEDDMSSDSATLVPTQQSVKAYVDAQVTAQDLDFQGDSGGALSIDLDSETMTFTGGTGIDTSGSGNAVTFAIDSTVTTLTGSQTLTNKTLTSPDVNTPDIDGGTIDGTVIGGSTAAAGTFTTFTSNGIDDNADAIAITIDSSENVGVGTTGLVDKSLSLESTYNLSWAESTNSSYANIFREASSAATVLANGYRRSETSNKMDSSIAASWAKSAVWVGSESIRFYADAASADAVGTDLTPTERMRINSSGNVGIGTDNPTGALTISKASSDNAINLIRTGSNTANAWIWANSDKIRFGDDNSGNPNNTRMCITTDTGRVGIGTTSPSATLDVDGTIKLEGSYPVGTRNTVLGETAFYSAQSSASYNVTVGFQAMYNNTTGTHNVGIGYNSLAANTTGTSHAALGFSALASNTTGLYNTAVGYSALTASTTANYNTAVGYSALSTNSTGANNTAVGGFALEDNTTGIRMVAVGYGALRSNTTANSNVAVGYAALAVNTTGADNNALGRAALGNNTTGGDNNAFGYSALNSNTTGTQNTVMGHAAMDNSTTSSYSTALGATALTDLTTGSYMTALGRGALADATTANNSLAAGNDAARLTTTGAFNHALGVAALYSNTTGSYNTAVGYASLYNNTATGNVAIGHNSCFTNTVGVQLTGVGYGTFQNTTGSANTALGYLAGYANTSGFYNVAVGDYSLTDNTTGTNHVAVGHYAGFENSTGDSITAVGSTALQNNTTGNYNTALGRQAGQANTTGSNNTFVGMQAGVSNTTAGNNTAVGMQALISNTTGVENAALGLQALYSTSTGYSNTAIGNYALYANTTGNYGVAVGYQTLDANTTGPRNCAVGYAAMTTNTTGGYSTALGSYALTSQTTPNFNVAVGYQAGYTTSTGFDNTYLGTYAGYTGAGAARNVYIGYTAGYYGTGSNNVAVGNSAGDGITSGSNLTCLGYAADPSSGTATNEVTLGNSSVATLRCQVALTVLSDERDKKNIETLGSASDFIKALRPVSFDWNQRDGERIGQSDHGFIAQELKTAQQETNWHVPRLVYESNPDKLEASYATLLPSVVSALQEALAEIESLKAQVAELSGE
jgi:hypothetical protein